MFREYVPDHEYFPTLKEVTDFKNEYWEEKILKTEMLDENVFTYLKPEGMISLRLSHPKHAFSFDRVPRRNDGGVKTSQSSGEKFSKFDFLKLGDFYVGDVIKLIRVDMILVPGERQRVPCQMYLMIQSFYVSDSDYFAEGNLFFHSSMRQMRDLVDVDSYIKLKDSWISIKMKDLKLEQTLRHHNLLPTFCPSVYDERQQAMIRLSAQELASFESKLDVSLR